MRYYERAKHITVITPNGRETDITSPQHELQGKSKEWFKRKKFRELTMEELEHDKRALERFKTFVKAISRILAERR